MNSLKHLVRDFEELSQIGSHLSFEGVLEIDSGEAHFFSKLKGTLIGKPGSIIHLKEGSEFKGKIEADELILEGFAQGEFIAKKRLLIKTSARVFGKVECHDLVIEPGAMIESQTQTMKNY